MKQTFVILIALAFMTAARPACSVLPMINFTPEERVLQSFMNSIDDWPEVSKTTAHDMAKKYGLPDMTTDDELRWTERGPWSRIVVYRSSRQHALPMKHRDLLEQAVRCPFTVSKVSELSVFSQVLVLDFERGEIAARFDREELNVLVLNLAYEILSGRKTGHEARCFFARIATESPFPDIPETRQLLFGSNGEKKL